MTLLDMAEELRKLEADDARAIQFFGELLEAAPALLQVLGCFQRGDAAILQRILDSYWLEADDHAALDRLMVAGKLIEG